MTELITLPNGSSLIYKDASHAYHLVKEDGTAGKRLANVSTVVKPLDTGVDGLMDWAVGLAYEGVVELFGGEDSDAGQPPEEECICGPGEPSEDCPIHGAPDG